MAVTASPVPADPVAEAPVRSRPAGLHAALPALTVLLVSVLLAGTAALVPTPGPNLLAMLMVVIGIAALVVGIRWHRPDPATGWWVLAVSAMGSLGGVVVIVATLGIPDPTLGTAESPVAIGSVPTVLFTLAYLSTGAGLALVGRVRESSSGWVDLIDALLLVSAAFPLLWFAVVDPLLDQTGFDQPATGVLPAACLLILALAVKLIFSVGLRWSALWLLAAALALLATNIRGLLPILVGGSVVPGWTVPVMWAAYPVALGMAGLHPSIARTVAPAARPDQLSVARLLMLGALGLAVPFAFIFDDVVSAGTWLRDRADLAAVGGSVLVVALLLVSRLAITARVAQRRAGELARQARALAVAAQEQEALRQQLTYRALHDPLTGLANRVVLAERLEWALSRRGSGRHALLLLDLDGFKDVNDTLGHQLGDELLMAAAHRCLALVPEGGMLARLGGDEFAALLEEVDDGRAAGWAAQVLQAMRRPFRIAGRRLYLTTSIGLALLDPADGQTTPSSALRDADLALYAAKAAGRDRMLRFEPAMVEARLTHSRLSAGLRRALANDEFRLHYQPVIDLATGQVRAVEALLRWHPAGEEPVAPAEFIPVAEETGMINDIGAWVLRHACADARTWWDTRGVAVAVNVSGRQLVDPGLARVVFDALSEAGLPGKALIIEVTETSMIATATVESVIGLLNRLRDQGVRVAIDDFGTGYSSLSYLARLPVDILKMDSSFTRHGSQLAFGPEDWPFARAIMELGEGLQLTTVAEGIETAEQAEALRRMNCQLAQGYLFSRPVPPEAIDQLLSVPAEARSAPTRLRPRPGRDRA